MTTTGDPRGRGSAAPGGDDLGDMLPGLRATVADAKVKAARTRERRAAQWEPAEADPVARLLLEVPLAHLDRPFDYAVPASMSDDAVPGARVKVRFAGSEVAGYVLERCASSDHTGRLQPLRRVVSAEPVLSADIAELCGRVAAHWAGTRADVVRLAVPPRHAATEKRPSEDPADPPRAAHVDAWREVTHADAFLTRVRQGASVRAVWGAAPGDDWAAMIAQAVARCLEGGRGAVVCVPDGRDVDRVSSALSEVLGEGHHAVLRADAGPAARYREFLRVSRGAVRVVVGTRAAAFAPVTDPGLFVVWDDGDEMHAEPRAPYPHTRDVLRLRAEQSDAAMLVGGFARTVEAEEWLASGWAHELAVDRRLLRERVRVAVVGEHERAVGTRIPRQAYEAIKHSLGSGAPVLVQTPRQGYAPALACERCRTPARCAHCHGPMQLSAPTEPPACRWCGVAEPAWACAECGAHGLRARVRGNVRTAEELGRAFPGVRVRSSHAEHVVDLVEASAQIVVATTGAEPWAPGGYGAVVVLDTWLTTAREDMRADEEALRRWSGAVGLAQAGARVVVVGEAAHPSLQALIRWDAGGFARREAAERAQAHLPPAARIATLTGAAGALSDALTVLDLPAHAEVLGPVPHGEEERVVLRVPAADGAHLVRALAELARVRSARKLEPVRVQVDPRSL